MENYINHLRPVKFPLAGAWPVWDFGDLISALCIRNGLGAATCALEHRGGLGKPSLCFNPSARFYFEAADLWIFRAEWAESHQWTPSEASAQPHKHLILKVLHVMYFHLHRGSFLSIPGVPDATGQFSTFLPITAPWCSHISHLHPPWNSLTPGWSFLRGYHWQGTAKNMITALFSCSRSQWSASLWGEIQFPSSIWDKIPHLLPNKRY